MSNRHVQTRVTFRVLARKVEHTKSDTMNFGAIDPDVPVILSGPYAKLRTATAAVSVEVIAAEPVNPVITFIANPSMKEGFDSQGPKTVELPSAW